jgi:predicted nucleotidyltransferase
MTTVPLTLKHLFSSKLRVKVLSHFFFHPGEDFYIRYLASALREPVGTVARELAHLEEAGILKHRVVGNQKHYSLQEDSPIAEDLRNIFLKTTGASAELRAALKKIPGVEIAFIYGSYASGEAGVSSDIDLMVIGDVSDKEMATAVASVEKRMKREINYTLYTRDEAEKRLGKKGDFVHEVFAGPKIILIGKANDRLLRAA